MIKTSRLTNNQKGFSLIEVIITLSIIVAIAAMAMPKFTSKNNDLRTTLRKMSVLCRDLKSRAKLTNATYRLVIDMGENNNTSISPNPAEPPPQQSFWVEKAQGEVLNNYDAKNPPKLPNADKDEKDKDKEIVSEFALDPKVFKTPQGLKGALIFESVELGTVDKPIKSGIVYLHFLPSGYSDEAAIHLKAGEKGHWTIAINPLTGHADVLEEYRALNDLRAQ